MQKIGFPVAKDV